MAFNDSMEKGTMDILNKASSLLLFFFTAIGVGKDLVHTIRNLDFFD